MQVSQRFEDISNIIIIPATLLLLICLLFALMFSYYHLLKRISVMFPKYYKQLGSPFLPTASRSITKTIGRDNYNYALLRKLFVGLPEEFPKDAQLQRLARHVQLELYLILALLSFGIGFGLIVFLRSI